MNLAAIFTSLAFALLLLLTPGKAISVDLVSHAPRSAQAYIIEPADGARVPETFKVQFGLSGMDLAPAGTDQPNTGHHHLLIDQQELPELTASLPATEQIRHFGKAQTETELTLEPGEHTLRLVLGNYLHVPHDNPVISEPITVTVQ
ncbi:MAG: hypothetical protein RLZZ04_2526 [Cyanobacteriota bacterium]|jgi:hypothetical protein